jgi:hypothetical protein
VLLGERRERQQVSPGVGQQLGRGREALGELFQDPGVLAQVEAASGWADTVRTSVAANAWADLGTRHSRSRRQWGRHRPPGRAGRHRRDRLFQA